ncbi:MAG: hypothetical protein Q8900_00505 [Bacillota bacterium]|nr:hypothetical protein [Bacillota bacterium]
MLKKGFIKGLSFIIILLIIMSALNYIFILKTDHRYKLTQGLYLHKGNCYDVVFIGSSHMNAAMDPNVLWNEYGITSFNYATGGQTINVTYYLLKEVLKQHKNPIVVVDLYYLGLESKYGDEGYTRSVIDNMRFSKNKLDAINNCTPAQDRINYLFPIFKYHYRWNQLKANDFNLDLNFAYYVKGFNAGTDRYGKANTSNTSVTEMENIPNESKEYLYKIIDLSKKNGFKLIFTNIPCDYNDEDGTDNWVKSTAKVLNTASKIAKENDIPYIDYNAEVDELGFDFKNDMNNAGHVNIWGSKILSSDFGKYLKTNYQLTDHRSDINYNSWNEEYKISQIESLKKQLLK